MSALIVFDLDGTLVDSRRDLADSTNDMLAAFGAPPLPVDRVVGMVGEGARVLVERALRASGLDPATPSALERFRDIYDRRLLIHTRPYPGIDLVVRDAAARSAVALLSNKPEAPSRRLLEAFGWMASFRWVIGGDGPFPRKPDPAGLRHLMAEAGVEAESTLVVGDSLVDLETARRAGARACAAAYGFAALDAARAGAGVELAATPAAVGAVVARFLAGAGA
jgi:phosphoglycolate phosphatase